MTITIEIFTGKNSEEYIETISRLRIEAFREYPYLYKGEFNYEKKYVRGYTSDDKAMIAIAKDGNELAGISTGIPLISDSEIVADAKNIFSKENINADDYYYYGEVIVLPKYRGLGITTKLFLAQDDLIKLWGFKHACILTVVREEKHPLKPVNYKSPDKIWEHLGFFRNKLTIEYHWPTIQTDNTVLDIKNTLEFWTKPLDKSIGQKTEPPIKNLIAN